MSPATTDKSRVLWIDVARAFAVIMVVLYHFLIWPYAQILGGGEPPTGGWSFFLDLLRNVRMPLLLALSGYLAAPAIRRGWASVRLRAVASLWLYYVWLTLFFAFYYVIYQVIPSPWVPEPVNTLAKYVTNLYSPQTVLWFLAAMAVYPVLTWGLKKLGIHPALVLAGAFALWLWGVYGEMPHGWGKIARSFIFYAFGVYAAEHFGRFSRAGWGNAIAAIAVFVAATFYLPLAFSNTISQLIASMIGIIAALIVFPLIVRNNWLTRGVAKIGERTTEIYVMHVPLLALIHIKFRGYKLPFDDNPAMEVLYVLGAVSAVVATCLTVGWVLRKVPGILNLPAPFERRLRAAARSQANDSTDNQRPR